MKLLVDMNLSPEWCAALAAQGWEAVHWSTIGNPSATDEEIMPWVAERAYAVLTHDLDLGAILAASGASGPSVIQIRTHDVLPDHLAPLLLPVLKQVEPELEKGALVVVDERRSRIRILPLVR